MTKQGKIYSARGMDPQVKEAIKRQAAARGLTQAQFMEKLAALLPAVQDYAGKHGGPLRSTLIDLGLNSHRI